MEYLIVLVVVAVVVYVVSAPLRARDAARAASPSDASAGVDGALTAIEMVGPDPVAELEAARDAKYREIRDAELDVRTGKLSDDDYEAIDSTLRSEAIEILNALDRARDTQRLPSAS